MMGKGSILLKVCLFLLLAVGVGNSSVHVHAETTLKMDNALKSKIHTIIKNATAADSNLKKVNSDYQAALRRQHTAESNLISTQRKYPTFIITGEIKTRKPFMVWGSAFSYDASMSHIGQRTTASNILVENPDQSKIMYGQYVMGIHYYKRVTTGKGIFGQTVPIYVYGGKPAELTQAERRVNTEKKNVQSAFKKITSYVDTKYSKKIKAKPKDLTLYVEKAIVLFNLSKTYNSTDLLSKAFATSKLAKDPINIGIYLIYTADSLKYDAKVTAYATMAKNVPNLVYNYPTTPDQFFIAGLALKPYKNYNKEAIYCFQKALGSKSSSTRAKAQGYIKELQKISVTSIVINSVGSVKVGESIQLSANISPTNATNKTIKWATSDPSIATITQDGTLTGVSKGTVEVTATADGITAKTTVNVRVGVTSISLISGLTVKIGDTKEVFADVSPQEAADTAITWTSSNESIAKIDSKGIVTGISEGAAIITATADGKSATCIINVSNGPDLYLQSYPEDITNNLITSVNLDVLNNDSMAVKIGKIEIYQQGSLYRTDTSAEIESYGISTTINPDDYWGVTIPLGNGIKPNNSIIKLTVTTNDGKEYTYEATIE
jgi:uncharacterized protein YjdB